MFFWLELGRMRVMHTNLWEQLGGWLLPTECVLLFCTQIILQWNWRNIMIKCISILKKKWEATTSLANFLVCEYGLVWLDCSIDPLVVVSCICWYGSCLLCPVVLEWILCCLPNIKCCLVPLNKLNLVTCFSLSSFSERVTKWWLPEFHEQRAGDGNTCYIWEWWTLQVTNFRWCTNCNFHP